MSAATLALMALTSYQAMAIPGDVNSALSGMTSKIKNIFETATTVMYAIAAIAGIIGAITLYQKWNTGDPNTNKLVGAWFGAAIFLGLAATFLKAVFF